MKLKPFEDLIKPIKYDGETFVPIRIIAELAFNHNAKTVENSEIWVNSSYDCKAYIKYSIDFENVGFTTFCIGIWRGFNVDGTIEIFLKKSIHTPNNQVQIVKNLIKWGFVEP